MNLKPRFLLLTGLLIVATAIVAGVSFMWLAEGLIARWGARLAEKQVLYDKERTLQPLLREIALAQQLAASQALKPWAIDPTNPDLGRKAIAEMESYRNNFRDRNFFVALYDSGKYFFNNAENEFADRQFRYVLSPRSPDDAWFYAIIKENRAFHINVNPDAKLGVVKLWIDVLMRDGNRVLGVVGTGLDLHRFIKDVANVPQPGIISIFVDHNAAIQLYRDPDLIDYASIVKTSQERKSLDLLLDRPEDRQAIRTIMKQLESGGPPVVSRFVEVEGKRYLAGIAFLPEIGWYEITLMDLDVLVPMKDFGGLLLTFGVTLLLALLIFNLSINRLLLRPLSVLDESMEKVRLGEKPGLMADGHSDEISRLIGHFQRMAETVHDERQNLEHLVSERTEALDRLTKMDPLTELLNRRGMRMQIESEISRAGRLGTRFGLIWLDIDWFKEINDQYGHGVGDQVLLTVARLIRATIRPYDSPSRWGGDEFLILLPSTDADSLQALAERLRRQVAETVIDADAGIAGDVDAGPVRLSVSVGGYLCQPGESLDSLLHMADQALYTAKAGGRDRVCITAQSSGKQA
jgi:diguanylate cyclase (GGDEF)-like protein